MSEPFIGEVRAFAFSYAPRGWAFCNGQLLPINQNQAMFALLGTTYGGNGQTTFGLPNLQGRVPVHMGNGIVLGQMDGEASHTLTVAEIANHNHPVKGNSGNANSGAITNNTWATQTAASYGTAPNAAMNAGAIGNSGGGLPHNNMQPYLVVNYCIALQGVFPSRN